MKTALSLVRSFGTAFLPAFSGFVTQPDEWYQNLEKPPLNPPDWVFAPVWTTLYALIGLANTVYSQTESPRDKTWGQSLNGAHLALNGTWSLVFFKGRSPLWAFVNIVLMLGFIVATINEYRKVSKLAALLLVPYLLWVGFATYLSFEIYRRNARYSQGERT